MGERMLFPTKFFCFEVIGEILLFSLKVFINSVYFFAYWNCLSIYVDIVVCMIFTHFIFSISIQLVIHKLK